MVAIHRGPGLGSLITALALVMNQFAYAAYDLDVNSLGRSCTGDACQFGSV